jgi:hypothetical protein
LQSLIIAHSNKGQAISGNKEKIDFGTIIGVYVDQSTGKEYPTTIGIINYSKDGTHVVPARPKGGKIMINLHEIETFEILYKFIHEHDEGKYQITFQDGTEVSAEYDTDYETDNGLDIDDAEYEEYIAIVFKNSIDGTLFEVSCFNFPAKVIYNGEQVI